MFRRTKAGIFAILIVLALFPSGASAAGNNGIAMNVSVGWGGLYTVAHVTPVLVTVKNDGEELSGALELLTGSGFSICVRKEVVLPKGTEKRFTLFVMASGIYKPKDFEVKLISGGKTMASAMPQAVTGVDPNMPLCGILSDDAAAVSYMKKLSPMQMGTRKWVELKPDDIYENADLMNSFGVIVVNNFDSSKLSDSQRASISQWVTNGGSLVLGGGPGRESTVMPWKDILKDLTLEGSSTVSELSELAALGQGRSLKASLPVCGLKSGSWTPAASSGDQPLVLHKDFGRGIAFLSAFDLGEGAIGSWSGNVTMWQTLFDQYAGQDRDPLGPGYSINYYGGSGMLNALQAGMAGGGFTFWLFIGLLALFSVLVGFVSFFILRAMGKQKLMWLTVPALSLVFTGVLLILGRNTFGRTPYMFAFTSTNIADGVTMSDRTIGLVAPAMGDYRVSVENAGLLFPQTTIDNNFYNNNAPPPKLPVSTIASADGSELDFINVNLNGSRLAQFGSFSAQAPLEIKLIYDGSNVNCTLKNTSDWTIEDATVVIGGTVANLGDLAPGAEGKAQMLFDQTPLQEGYWNAFQKMYPNLHSGMFNKLGGDDDEKIRGAFLQEQAGNLVNGAVRATPAGQPGQTTTAGSLGEALVLGWVQKPFEYAVKINGKTVKPQALDLVTSIAPITQEGGPGKLQFVKAYAQVNTSLSTTTGGMAKDQFVIVDPGGKAVLDFNLTEALKLNLSSVTLETGSPQGIPEGTWSIYNWSADTWDEASPKQRFTSGDLNKYIGADGIVRLSVQAGMNEAVQCTPFLWAQGVEK